MDLRDSLRRAARNYPGGVEALAGRLGKSPSTFEKELRGAPGFKLGADDAREAMLMCHEQAAPNALDYLNSLAGAVGALVVLLPAHGPLDANTMRGMAGAMQEFGEFMTAAANAAADGKITANELAAVDREMADVFSRCQAIRATMAAMHEAGKPAALRMEAGRGRTS